MSKPTGTITKTRYDGETPKDNHLIVEFRPGQFLALIPGSKMGIVIDATQRDELHKMALMKVTTTCITFKCMCNPTCTVIHEFKRGPTKGQHAR